MDFLNGLNAQQREAVAHTEGPLLILAGAGSGKTRVITHRIAHIITSRRVPPTAVLAVTFTNKAANEMRERVNALLADLSLDSSPNVSTFHSFCVRLLRRDGDPADSASAPVSPAASPSTTTRTSSRSSRPAIGRSGSTTRSSCSTARRSPASATRRTPSRRPPISTRRADQPETEKVAALFEEYEKALRNANALDFDDLLLEAVRLLQIDAATREAWNRRLSYVMVDEYQDTNRSQYELMRLLTEQHRNVCVVGDEDQSIYSWRGADIRNILDFEHDFPNAKTIRLEQNYRSTKNILAAAGAVVENNKARKGKKLWTEADAGSPIGLYAALRRGERGAVHRRHHREAPARGRPKDHVAVLYRTNSQSRQIEEALRRYGRKYKSSAASASISAPRSRTCRVHEAGGVATPIPSACCASSTRRRAASGAPRSSRSRSSPASAV